MDNPLKVNVDTFRRILKITISNNGKENVIDAVNKLKLRNDLESVSANYIIPEEGTVNDEKYNEQWNLEKIQLSEAWDIETGSSTIKVGVIDSGIDATHPDLQGQVDISLSKNFSPDFDTSIGDMTGHGTAVASIIGAKTNNSIGIAGICPNVRLVSLRVGSQAGGFYLSSVAEAISYATENDIPILNFSGGHKVLNEKMIIIIQSIKNYSGLFVCAAGNDGEDNDDKPHYPSSEMLNNLVSVGASLSNDTKKNSSNYGKNTVSIFAPGEQIKVAVPFSVIESGYGTAGETSFSSPHVAGVAALLLSKYPNMTPSEIKGTIMNNVDEMSAFSPICVSGGRLNAYKALINPHTHTFTYTSKNSISYHDRVCTTCYYYTESDIHFETVGYQWLNLTTHTMLCECGDLIERNHVVSSDAYNSGASIAPCLLCGGNATIGFIEIQNNILKISENGSFILSNGLVVLVDEDIEAYMNGTLIFRNNDEDII